MNRETPMHSVTLTGAGLAPRLIKRAPAENQFRFYQLGLWPDLFGGCDLMREYRPGRAYQGDALRDAHGGESGAREALPGQVPARL